MVMEARSPRARARVALVALKTTRRTASWMLVPEVLLDRSDSEGARCGRGASVPGPEATSLTRVSRSSSRVKKTSQVLQLQMPVLSQLRAMSS